MSTIRDCWILGMHCVKARQVLSCVYRPTCTCIAMHHYDSRYDFCRAISYTDRSMSCLGRITDIWWQLCVCVVYMCVHAHVCVFVYM